MGQNLIWTEGRGIVIGTIALSVILLFARSMLPTTYIFGHVLIMGMCLLLLLFLLFSFYFFRNPDRYCLEAERDSQILICPSDGKIVEVTNSNGMQKVAIFLSPLDVHVNWMPMSGTVQSITYRPGKFVPAYIPKCSEYNEQLDVYVTQSDRKKEIIVRQIAGMLARRIVCWLLPKQKVTAGEKYGMIKFGSRVEVLLPQSVELFVQLNDRVYGGKTVLGRWRC